MLRQIFSLTLCVCLSAAVVVAQSAPSSPATPTQPQNTANAAQALPKSAMAGFGLEDGTPIKLRTSRTISSADAHTGDTLDFEVLEDVLVKGILVVPKGSLAWGTVTEAQPKRRMARGGKLNVNIDSVRLADGEKVPLRAVKDVKGGGHTGAMTGAMVATGIVFFPAAPLFLFMHGKDITIAKGTEITAYINGDTRLQQAKFQVGNTDTASASAPVSSALIEIVSTPPGGDIEIDGKFVGSTPSSINVNAGDHDIAVKKAGFTDWNRKINVSTGHVNISAELTPQAK